MSAVQLSQKFAAWTVALVDPTGKRVTVICQCGVAGQIAVDALSSGESKGCGCRLTPRSARDASRPSGFSAASREMRSTWPCTGIRRDRDRRKAVCRGVGAIRSLEAVGG
jgi:hypothetical protein